MKFFRSILLSAILLTVFFSACTLNNVDQDNSSETYFKQNNLKGTFALLDNVHEQFTVYNLKAYRDSSFAPGGTFQVLSTLLALETGRYLDEQSKVVYAADTDTISLGQAFLTGDDRAMASVAAAIGKDTLQFWLDSLHYGKAKMQRNDENIWNNDSLKLTPDEQLGFIAKLYFVQLPFQKRVQQIVRKLMTREENTLYTLAYKSSWDQLPSGKYSGWISGWIEENKHVYFFVLHGEPENGQPGEGALLTTLKAALRHYGFFEGKK